MSTNKCINYIHTDVNAIKQFSKRNIVRYYRKCLQINVSTTYIQM